MTTDGRAQLFPNVAATGVAYVATVIIGFVMPRLISDAVGPVSLGIWDLGWSFLAYLNAPGFGFGSAISYHLAKLAVANDAPSARAVIKTGTLFQVLLGLCVMLIFFGGANLIAYFSDISTLENSLIIDIGTMLSFAALVLVIGEVSQSILIAHHKTRVSEVFNVAHDVSLAFAMAWVLMQGHGIVGLAVASFVIRAVIEVVRASVAINSLAPTLSAKGGTPESFAQDLFRYGTKTSITVVQDLVVFQTARLAIFLTAGPAALAAFSRYGTISRQINRIADRFGTPIPTVISGYSAEQRVEDVRRLATKAAQGMALVSFPILVLFGLFGDHIVRIWMGDAFVIEGIALVFAGGSLFHASYSISSRILGGINSHGRIALTCLCVSGITMLLLIALFGPEQPVITAILMVSVMTVLVHLPYFFFTFNKLNLDIVAVAYRIFILPLLGNVPFLILLLIADQLLTAKFNWAALALIAFASCTLIFTYWCFILEHKTKDELRDLLNSILVLNRN